MGARHLFLVPGTSENIQATITRSVSWETMRAFLGAEECGRLQRSLGQNPVHCWAVTESNRGFYEKIEPGDLFLLTEKKTGCFRFLANIADKTRCASLGEALWPVSSDKPWEYIYFLINLRRIDVPQSKVALPLGYDQNFRVMGSKAVSDERIKAISRQYGNLETFIEEVTAGKILKPVIASASVREEASVVERAARLIAPPNDLEPLAHRIEKLRRDPNHQERDHESLVEEFYKVMGYRPSEITYRRGRIDILVERDGRPYLLNEVKREWGLTKDHGKVVEQAFGYALQQGVRYVVVTNGDYYALFDRSKPGFKYDDYFEFDFRLTELQERDLPKLDWFRKG